MFIQRQHQLAVTLLELLVVLVIVAILAGVGYPNYVRIKQESRRQDAHVALTDSLNIVEQELILANSTDWTAITINAESQQKHYDIAKVVSDIPANGAYMITATPKGTQAADTDCPLIRLYQKGHKEPSSCW